MDYKAWQLNVTLCVTAPPSNKSLVPGKMETKTWKMYVRVQSKDYNKYTLQLSKKNLIAW